MGSLDNMTQDTNGSSGNNNLIKKKRVGKACDGCRIKKTKCDGKKPCSKCINDNKICIYTKRKKNKDKFYNSEYVELLEKKLFLVIKSMEKLSLMMLSSSPNEAQDLQNLKNSLSLPFSINQLIQMLLTEKDIESFEDNYMIINNIDNSSLDNFDDYLNSINNVNRSASSNNTNNNSGLVQPKPKKKRGRKSKKELEELERQRQAELNNTISNDPNNVKQESLNDQDESDDQYNYNESDFSDSEVQMNPTLTVDYTVSPSSSDLSPSTDLDDDLDIEPSNNNTDLNNPSSASNTTESPCDVTSPSLKNEYSTTSPRDLNDNNIKNGNNDRLSLGPFQSGAALAAAAVSGLFKSMPSNNDDGNGNIQNDSNLNNNNNSNNNNLNTNNNNNNGGASADILMNSSINVNSGASGSEYEIPHTLRTMAPLSPQFLQPASRNNSIDTFIMANGNPNPSISSSPNQLQSPTIGNDMNLVFKNNYLDNDLLELSNSTNFQDLNNSLLSSLSTTPPKPQDINPAFTDMSMINSHPSMTSPPIRSPISTSPTSSSLFNFNPHLKDPPMKLKKIQTSDDHHHIPHTHSPHSPHTQNHTYSHVHAKSIHPHPYKSTNNSSSSSLLRRNSSISGKPIISSSSNSLNSSSAILPNINSTNVGIDIDNKNSTNNNEYNFNSSNYNPSFTTVDRLALNGNLDLDMNLNDLSKDLNFVFDYNN